MAVTRETLIHRVDCRWISRVPSVHTVTDYLEVLRDLSGPPKEIVGLEGCDFTEGERK